MMMQVPPGGYARREMGEDLGRFGAMKVLQGNRQGTRYARPRHLSQPVLTGCGIPLPPPRRIRPLLPRTPTAPAPPEVSI